MKKHWWKIACGVLLFYTFFAGFTGEVPARHILNESIRNLYFHVPMWFTMIALYAISFGYSIHYLRTGKLSSDHVAASASTAGMVFGLLGIITGSIWAKYTWGAWWTNDVKLNGAAVSMLVYLAYTILRGSVDDDQKRGRISAVYNIFAFVMMLVLIMVLPRMYDSLHPGNGGNPAFNMYDLDGQMRLVFYPAVMGWILLGIWMMSLMNRIKRIEYKY